MTDFHIWLYGALVFVYLTIVLSVVLVVVLENRQPVKTVAWILVLTSLPVLGLILYAFFGRNVKREALISRACAIQLARRSVQRFYKSSFPDIPEEHARLMYLFRRKSAALPYADNTVDVFTRGGDMLEQLLHDLRGACRHIHVEFYIFENDEAGRQVSEVLKQKAREGVEVRLIYDDVGCWNVPASFFKDMRKAGVQVHGFLPVRFPKLTSKVNYRNHRKIVVVDGEMGYVGGMNVANRYFNGAQDGSGWRDTHLRLTGNAVAGLQRAFLADWYVGGGELITDARYYPCGTKAYTAPFVPCTTTDRALVQIVTSIPTNEWHDIMQGLILVLMRAKRYCYIQSPYFIPTDRMLFAMQTAALAGVDVRLMLSEKADKKILTWASRSYLADVMRAGVRVYLYRPTFLHAKVWVSDDSLFSCGSTNVDFRSFEHNFEINAFVYNKKMAQAMRRVFLADQQKSRLLNLERWNGRSTWRRLSESFIRLLTPLL